MPLRPTRLPERPFFSSGPTAKPPGYSVQHLAQTPFGRSNRSNICTGRIKLALDQTRDLLAIPQDYQLLFVPGSDTGAFEAAMWNLLGERRVQVLAFESFGQLWAEDATTHLKLDAEILSAPYGDMPDLTKLDPQADWVFPWNGTTSGVCMANEDFLDVPHDGLRLCDATSALFCVPVPIEKLDVVTFSFQKALGGEAGLGALILSPKAVDRLNRFDPKRPIPKVLRLRKSGAADLAILSGDAINTYSFLVIEDYLQTLKWAFKLGGLRELFSRTKANFEVIEAWVKRTAWVDFVANEPSQVSKTSVCLKFIDPILSLGPAQLKADIALRISRLLEQEGAAFDVNGYRAAPPGLRIWCGPTVNEFDLIALMPWLDWAYDLTLNEISANQEN